MNEIDPKIDQATGSRPDTVATLPDRAAIMRPKWEPRRNRKSRLIVAASVAALLVAVAGAGLAVQSFRQQSASERLAHTPSPDLDDRRLRARLAVLADLEAARTGSGAPAEPPQIKAEVISDRLAPPADAPAQETRAEIAGDPLLLLPNVPLPDEAAPLTTEAFAIADSVPLPPERPAGMAEQVSPEATPQAAAETPAPAAISPSAVATGRVIALTETPLPPRRPHDLPVTPTQRTTSATAPPSQADRTATRPVQTRTRVFVHYSALDPEGRGRAERIARRLAAEGFEVADLRSRGVEIMTSNVRYYHPQDRSASSVVRDIVDASFPDLGLNETRLRDFGAYPTPPSQGVVELWLASWSEPTGTPLR